MKYLLLPILASICPVLSRALVGTSLQTNLIARAPPLEWIPVNGATGRSDIQLVRSHTATVQHERARAARAAEARIRQQREADVRNQAYQAAYQPAYQPAYNDRPAVVYEDQAPIGNGRRAYEDQYAGRRRSDSPRGERYQDEPQVYRQDRDDNTRRRQAYDDFEPNELDFLDDALLDDDQARGVRDMMQGASPGTLAAFRGIRDATPADVARENSQSRHSSTGGGSRHERQSITYQSPGRRSGGNTPPDPQNIQAPTRRSPPVYIERSPRGGSQYVNPGDYLYRSRHHRRDVQSERYHKRLDPLQEISSDSNTQARQSSNSSVQAEFEEYLAFYYETQNNISAALFPFFDTVLNNTNSSEIYNTVWSVFSDITGIGPKIIGPFAFGLHCFDWLEDAYLNVTQSNDTMTNSSSNTSHPARIPIQNATYPTNATANMTTNGTTTTDPVFQYFLASNYMLLQVYNYTWNGAMAIANETGQVDLLDGLTDILLGYNLTTSSSWTSAQPQFDSSYFETYVMDRVEGDN